MDNLKLMDRLRDLRKEKGLTQAQVAEILNVDVRTYSDYERGKFLPKLEYLDRLADLYGVSTDYLLGRSDFRSGAAGEFIHSATGLSDQAVQALTKACGDDTPDYSRRIIVGTINTILSEDTDLLLNIRRYIDAGSPMHPTNDYIVYTDAAGDVQHHIPVGDQYLTVIQNNIVRDLETLRRQKK